MFQEQIDDLLGCFVGVLVKTEFLEVRIAPHQLRGCIREHFQESFECRSIQRCLEIFDDVELDAALFEDGQSASGLASAGVMENVYGHGAMLVGSTAQLAAVEWVRGSTPAPHTHDMTVAYLDTLGA
jgi:hypothetical protein